ncbi:hypothetical protein LCGC14_2889180, partial [marine sediment metagenome]
VDIGGRRVAQQQVPPDAEQVLRQAFPMDRDIQGLIQWADQNPGEFAQTLFEMGRIPETEAILAMLGATEGDIREFYEPVISRGEPVGLGDFPVIREPTTPPLEVPVPFPFPGTAFHRQRNLEAFQEYRRQGGKLSADQWRRQGALIRGEIEGRLQDDVFRRLAGLPITSEMKLQRQKFTEEHPLAAQFMAGWGDVIATGAGALQWLGQEELGQSFRGLAKPLREDVLRPEMPELGWKSAVDPMFWGNLPQFLARNTPFTLSLVPAMIAGYTGGAAIAGAAGLSALWSTILGAVGATALSRPMESALEAGGTYDEAIARGMTPEEATEAANSVFLKNLSLAGLDVAQLAAAFLPTPARIMANPFLKLVVVGGKVVGTGLTEAGEEMVQE